MNIDDPKILANVETVYNFLSSHPIPTLPTDFMLVLGSHDLMVPVLAAELFHEKAAPLVVCSGGHGKITKRLWRESEGKTFAKKCLELGVPKSKILVENRAKNTGDNFNFTRNLLSRKGIKVNSGLIVCKPYMARRALATATKQWPEVTWHVATPKVSFKDYISKTDQKREISVIVGDLERMRVYADRGFQTPVNIPDDVWQAYEFLKNSGFTKFTLR